MTYCPRSWSYRLSVLALPVLFSFLVLQFASLRPSYWMHDLFHRLCPSGIPSESQSSRKEQFTGKIFFGYQDGLHYIWHQKRNFSFSPLGSFSVNFFFAAFEFCSHFSNRLYGVKGLLLPILTLALSAQSSETLIANKFKSSMEMLLFLLILTGVGVFMMGLPLHLFFPFLEIWFVNSL